LPPVEVLNTFSKAKTNALHNSIATSIHISVWDVEVQTNPTKKGNTFLGPHRPGTFARVMTVSPAGVYLHQAYVGRGYTLPQHMEKHDATFPMSLEEADVWAKWVEDFAADLSGVWSKKTSDTSTLIVLALRMTRRRRYIAGDLCGSR
jgi:hypothetical protein